MVCCLIPMAQAKRAPNLELKDLKGNKQKISDLRGSIAVVNFWATWCAPCMEVLSMLSRIGKEYSGKKVRFIAASTDEDKNRSKVDDDVTHIGLAAEVWLGADLGMLDRAGLGNVLPATMIMDEQGEVVARVLGQAHEEDIKGPVEWLLNGKSGQPPPPVTKRY
jgi:thiol-disulfide isomerase/thioredoxin